MRGAAVVLAAGQASRYRAAGGPAASKLVHAYRGEALVRHAVRAALGCGLPVVVVTGHAEPEVRAALDDLAVRLVFNPAFASGLASSLSAGLQALDPGCEAAVILLGDMPRVNGGVIAALIAASDATPDAQAVVPVLGGVRGNPVLLRRPLFAAASRLTGDEGARRLLRDPGTKVLELALDDAAIAADLDDPAAFERDAAAGPGAGAAPVASA